MNTNTIATSRTTTNAATSYGRAAALAATDGAATLRVDAGLALMRIVAGIIFVAHGAQKLFVWGFEGVSAGFASMGVPMAGLMGPLVGFAELFGGLALMLGLLTRFAGAGLVPVMLGALFLVHAPAGFFLPNGYEFVLLLAAVAGGFALIGGGRYSADALIARRKR